jgi:hypothetical protein
MKAFGEVDPRLSHYLPRQYVDECGHIYTRLIK